MSLASGGLLGMASRQHAWSCSGRTGASLGNRAAHFLHCEGPSSPQARSGNLQSYCMFWAGMLCNLDIPTVEKQWREDALGMNSLKKQKLFLCQPQAFTRHYSSSCLPSNYEMGLSMTLNPLNITLNTRDIHTGGFSFICSFLLFMWVVTKLLWFVYGSLVLSETSPWATHK